MHNTVSSTVHYTGSQVVCNMWDNPSLNNSLTSRHTVWQLLLVLRSNDVKPLVDDSLYKLLLVWGVLCRCSSLQLGPQIFNGVEIWAVPRPFQYFNVIFVEPRLAFLCSMAWCTILLEDKWLVGTKDDASNLDWRTSLTYFSAFTISFSTCRRPTQSRDMPPHTIMLRGCFMVAVVHLQSSSNMKSAKNWKYLHFQLT